MIRVPFTIPGERVRVRVHTSRDGRLVASVEEMLQPSSHRVEPRCPHFGSGAGPAAAGPHGQKGCGGCAWQHIAYAEQLRLKAEMITRLVRAAVPKAPPARATIPGTPLDSPWGYRQKVHFVFGSGSGSSLAMGHYGRGTRRVIPVTQCPVHDERGNLRAFSIHDALVRANVNSLNSPPAARTLSDPRVSAVKGVAVRVGANTPEIMTTLVLTGAADRRIRAATRTVMDDRSATASWHVNIHPRGDALIFGRETRRLSGQDRMREVVAGVSFLISPTAFFQTNVRAAGILVRLVLDAVPSGSRVLDLYAGAGLFALPLARAGHQVLAVEESRASVADGEASRRLNGIGDDQCQFVDRRVEDVLRREGRLPPSRGARGRPRKADPATARFDVVVMDPPRAGCSPEVIRRVFGDARPWRAVYVSCHPEALARDLREIVALGYDVESLQPVDMFPHTAHIETVAILTRSKRRQRHVAGRGRPSAAPRRGRPSGRPGR